MDLKTKARELADMVGSIVVDEELPLEILELTADLLKEDGRQIKEAAEAIMEEVWEIGKYKFKRNARKAPADTFRAFM